MKIFEVNKVKETIFFQIITRR